ncbi:MFS transporter [Alicyclobacillus acidiphilus]|uniref:MFS transporter n=2 Tax=Alicyclobacillus acidiphilus TaxID=182455 RepID=UPI002893540D|nr:MFS transporter [Alicyclobacillus acidiphilus]
MQTQTGHPSVGHLNRTMIMIVMVSGAFVSILNETLLNVALPPIMRELHIAATTAQWLTTGYMLTNGVLIPVTAFLIQRFTTRTLFLTAMSLFAVGTLIAAVSPDFGFLLVGRVVQASGAAIMLPLLMTTVLTVFAPHERGGAMGIMGLVIMFAPAIGPTLSGWLVEHHSWRILFFVIHTSQVF